MAGGVTYKHTIHWDPADWIRLQTAAERLSEQTKAAVSVPNFIRGAALHRAAEVVGHIAPTDPQPPAAA